MENKTQFEAGTEAIKAIAVASKTPFWTAFKVTMGVAAAQLVITILFFSLLIGGCVAGFRMFGGE